MLPYSKKENFDFSDFLNFKVYGTMEFGKGREVQFFISAIWLIKKIDYFLKSTVAKTGLLRNKTQRSLSFFFGD